MILFQSVLSFRVNCAILMISYFTLKTKRKIAIVIMNIHGFTKTTLLDYPGHTAATIFTGNCNLRCPFCHNYDLVLNPEVFPKEDDELILAFLKKRFGILKGVCITGGEPTLQHDLAEYIGRIKDIGYKVKLDTNGFNPDVLLSLIDNKLIDYAAIDIKAGHNNYAKASGLPQINLKPLEETISILSKNTIDYEFRTTAVKGIHTDADFEDISTWLPGDCRYFIQNYNKTDGIGDMLCESFDSSSLNHFLDIVKPHIPLSSLRGVD